MADLRDELPEPAKAALARAKLARPAPPAPSAELLARFENPAGSPSSTLARRGLLAALGTTVGKLALGVSAATAALAGGQLTGAVDLLPDSNPVPVTVTSADDEPELDADDQLDAERDQAEDACEAEADAIEEAADSFDEEAAAQAEADAEAYLLECLEAAGIVDDDQGEDPGEQGEDADEADEPDETDETDEPEPDELEPAGGSDDDEGTEPLEPDEVDESDEVADD